MSRKQDRNLHDFILDNPEADLAQRRRQKARAIDDGRMTPEEAELVFGDTD